MKILVVGYQRSGTTLLRRLIGLHPDVVTMLHEKKLLNHGKNKKNILKYVNKYSGKCTMENNWGEKVPFYGKTSILSYCKKWIKIFGDEARVIHIIRHPIDVAISNVKMNKSPAKSFSKAVNLYNNVYPNFLDIIEKSDERNKTFIISFETLVYKPKETMVEVFKFCNLRSDEKIINKIISSKKDKLRYFDGINSDRAFSYKKEGYDDSKIDYEKIRRYERIINDKS